MKYRFCIITVLVFTACKKQKPIEHQPIVCNIEDKTGIYAGTYRSYTPDGSSLEQDTIVVTAAVDETCVVGFSKRISTPRYVLPSGSTIQRSGNSNGDATFDNDTLHFIRTEWGPWGKLSEVEFIGHKL